MARKKAQKAHHSLDTNPRMPNNTEVDGSRQRHVQTRQNGSWTPPRTKEINVEKAEVRDERKAWSFAGAMGVGAAMIHMTVPKYMSWVVMMSLIFGGCCSNVYALESIIKEESDSGLLITFTQFVIVALFTLPAHFSIKHPPFFLKPRKVPLIRWVPNIVMFFAVNLLNNFAFGYNISVPVHIILRSGGSVMTMLVGYLWGKRYTKVQVFSVAMLTAGIIMAAMADAQSKGKTSPSSATLNFDPSLLTGLLILFIAQLLSAIMGLYTQLTYAKYGSHWHENLLYSHFLSLPLFLPFAPSLLSQFKILLSSPPTPLTPLLTTPLLLLPTKTSSSSSPPGQLPPILTMPSTALPFTITLPKHILTLLLNALTQYVCIRGVNLLAARTSALGVSIVLNVRKLVSLFVSIWLFGNRLPVGVMVGAGVVFGSAGVWGWEGGRRERDRRKGE
ncbi:hypothetical protein JMJ35_006560 [Cladonia borealis]|uniref:UAA transporter n=1 Tax=Cladonia borealis TaxID=184061 RepID=A0AA39QXH5_9LECA|nr:hypothetical protein JMJ35_006560 [Cladonia borealis]